ncbi:MAG: hypothetical protein IJQ75_04745, partial [Synergistaceae bacterium]|nr:hypothetical protein [Synergistaceae bacterium]
MKKFAAIFTLVMLLAFPVCALAADTAKTEGVQASPEFYAKANLETLKGKKLGITIQSLQNAYWAGVMTALGEILQAAGAEYT